MRIALMKFLAIPLMLALAAVGCTSNPVREAGDDPISKAYAVLGTYKILQEETLALIQDQNIPAGVRQRLKDAEASAFPVVTELAKAVVEVESALDALAVAGLEADEQARREARLRIATENLSKWTVTALNRIAAFKAAKREASEALKRMSRLHAPEPRPLLLAT